ncbi:MAG: hypothetical protein ACYCZX_13555 [Rhodospirillaceae bacterium]
MAKTKSGAILWTAQNTQNYTAAGEYLSLLFNPKRVSKIVRQLRKAPLSRFKAKDIFRASQLSLLGVSNLHVEKDRRKIAKGTGLSPLLLVRDEVHSKLIVADGYHRLCAIYGIDENAVIQCRIV